MPTRDRQPALFAYACIALTLCGCQSGGYWAQRGADLGDVFRVRLALAVGLYAEVEATPLVHASAGFLDATLAPRGSLEWDPVRRAPPGEVRTATFPALLVGWPVYGWQETRHGYGDTRPYLRGFVAPFILMGNHHVARRSHALLALDTLVPNPRLVDPVHGDLDPSPILPPAPARWGWFGFSVTPLLGRFDLGFNPLELIDLITGLVGFDLLGDDESP